MLVALTSGARPGQAPRAQPYPLTNLTHMAGAELCDALGSGVSLCLLPRRLLAAPAQLDYGLLNRLAAPGWGPAGGCDPG